MQGKSSVGFQQGNADTWFLLLFAAFPWAGNPTILAVQMHAQTGMQVQELQKGNTIDELNKPEALSSVFQWPCYGADCPALP